MRAWCIGCSQFVTVEPAAIDRCPNCNRRYSLKLLADDDAPPGKSHVETPASDKPLDWVRLAVGWSMMATLLVIVWSMLADGSRVDHGQPGSMATMAGVLALTFLTFRLRLVRVMLALAGIILLTLWMWAH